MPTLTATLVITPIPNQATSAQFQVSGTYTLNQSTWTDTLVYEDDHGSNVPIASPAVQLGVSSWHFTHAALPPGTHTVSVKDPLTGTVTVSNSFTVGVAQTITANQPQGVVAGAPFNFTGILTNFATAPTLTYSLNGGTATPLTGVTNTGWSIQLTLASAGNYTLSVTNGSIVSNTVSFAAAPVTVNHVISANPPTAVSSPNYIFYDTFTSLNDITDTGGAGTAGAIVITSSPAGQSFTDNGGNVWTIVSGVVKQNGANAGFSANVVELAYVNGTIWQENASNQWYSWSAPSTWTAGANPLSGGTNGAWMNHYAFGGSEFTLSANSELEYLTSNTRTPGFSPFTLQNNGAGPGLIITCDTTPQATFHPGHTPSNPLNLPYNSGAIVSCTETNGEPTPGLFQFTYGLIEIQALLPGGSGTWVGFELYRLPTVASPGASGELDIIENGGGNVTQVFGSIHSSTIGQSRAVTVTDYTVNRHIYAVNWQPDFMTWYVDGQQYAQVATPPDFIDSTFYIALDFAMQGNPNLGFDGVPNASTPAPNTLTIDFVRVSQGTKTGGNTIAAGQLVNFTGTLSGYTAAPSLTYIINNGPRVAMTGVTATGWSMQFNAPTAAGAYTISVSDGTTAGGINFQVGTASLAITPIAPSGAVAGQSFTFQGVLAGYTTIPALHYALNGGAAVLMTGVSITGWSMSISVPAAGNYTVVVTDGSGTSGTTTFTVTASNTALRNWYQNPAQDNSFWVQPFQSSANWITSGSLITALRGGTPSINVKGNFAAPWYIGKSGDPSVTVTDGTHSIVVKIPLGAIIEGPTSQFDQSIGGVDSTQPYLLWSISGATCNTGAVAASGSVITGTYGFAVQDGSGLIMVDAVTGAPGDNNSIGGIQDYELQQISSNANYVIQHMLAYQLDPSFQVSSAGPVWPLKVIDTSAATSGPIPQGCTVGIPASVTRPLGQTRGYYALWDCFQQFGGFFYNMGATGGINLSVYDSQNAFASLVADITTSWPAVAAQLCILNPGDAPNYTSGASGAQFSLATTKGAISGSTNAFTGPPLLDLSPTGGVNIAPATFGAWYPSGYNVTPTNNTTGPSFSIVPNAPNGVVVNAVFQFSGSLNGYAAAPTLTYTLDSGTATPLSGVLNTGWSAPITITTSGTHTITVTDAAHGISGATTFVVSPGGAPNPTPVTWNPGDLAGGIVLSNGNYTATATGSTTAGAAHQGVRATSPINAALIVLWEVRASTITQNWTVGVANSQFGLAAGGGLGANATGIGAYPSTGTGSQPPQTVYFQNAQLTAGNGVADVSGDVITCCTNGSNFFFSTPAMRSTSGVQWNNNTAANPITASAGFSFSPIGATYYPVFNTLEGGGVAVLNDGTSTLSSFAAAFISANPQVVTLSGQVPAGPTKTITPATPTGVTTSTPFSFTGALSGYATAPTLTYSINGGTPTALPGVTSTGWSTTLTINAAGSYTISVTDGSVTGSTSSFTVGSGGASPTITGVAFTPASSIVAGSAIGTPAGQLTVTSANGTLTGVTYALTSTANFKVTTTGQIQFNFVPVAAGSYPLNVTITATNAANSPQTFGFTVVVISNTQTGTFRVNANNGTMIAPDGTTWVGRGTAIRSFDLPTYVTNAACQPLTNMFPGINMLRLSAYSYFTPQQFLQQINWLTAQKIVVVIEDHMSSTGSTGGGGQGVVFTGSQLQNELNWYAALATQFKSNTYVWFGTNNEPPANPSLAALYTWQIQTYQAIRNTGSNAIVEFEQINPFEQGGLGGQPASTFASCTNVVFGPHYYSWIWGGNNSTVVPQSTIYSSSAGSANSKFGGIVQQIQTIRFFPSADGPTVPVGCFEFGPSTDGTNLDVSGTNDVNAVFQAINAGNLFCGLSWIINDSGPDNEGTTGGLTSWGNMVAAQIAAGVPKPQASLPPAPGATPVPVGATWFVNSVSGNDGNNGTSAGTPFASLGKAESVCNASGGDLVLVYSGNYAPFTISGINGNASRWTVFKAQTGQSPVIVATTSTSVAVQFTNASYIYFQGFELAGTNSQLTLAGAQANPGATQYNTNGIQIGQFGQPLTCHHINIIGNYSHDFPQSGITAQASDYITIQGNRVVGNSLYSHFAGSGISIGVAKNFDTAAGYHIQVIGNLLTGNKMLVNEINTTRISDGEGIIIDDNHCDQTDNVAYTAKTLVANNICYNNGSSGLLAFDSSNVDFINNTCYLNCTVIHPQEIDIGASDLCNVWNNIVWASPNIVPIANDSSGVQQGNQTAPVGPSTFGFNMVFGGNGTVPPGSGNIVGQNPNFLSTTAFNFSLAAGSPALGAGANTSFKQTTDFNGNARPGPNGYSLGAID